MKDIKQDTRLVHADRILNKPEDGAVHQSTNNSVLFAFDDVADLESVFQGKSAGHVYSRSSSSSAVALQNMLASLDGGIAATCFATGMSAISAAMFSLLKAGDHLIVSNFLFGNTRSFFDNLQNFGLQVDYVDTTDAKNIAEKVRNNTKIVFCETIANPGTQIADLRGIGTICSDNNILFIVDNTMTPSVMFDAKSVGVNLLTTSLTKYVAGHGNVLGGAVIDLGNFDWSTYANIDEFYKSAPVALWGTTQIRKKGLRDIGATLAPQSAHLASIGLETLSMRMQKTCENALILAKYLESHDAINKVNYPGLSSHPQHKKVSELFNIEANNGQQVLFGGILSIELAINYDVRRVLNALNLVLSATHLGDTRTLALPVATTIFYENGLEKRQQMGISENLIRLSVGLEHPQDLINDFKQALSQ